MRFGEIRRGVRRLMRLAIRSRHSARRDAEEELEAVLQAREEQLRALGYSEADARAEAVRRMGGTLDDVIDDVIQSAEHRERAMSIRETLSEFGDDIRISIRGLRRDALFAGFVMATLALGIGANAAMFSVADRLLLRGPSYIVNPNRVMRVYRHSTRPDGQQATNSSYGWVVYDILRSKTESFAGVAAYSIGGTNTFGRGANAELVNVGAVTHDFFALLGVRPEVGRFFNAVEDAPTAPQHVVVLGHGLWLRAFGGDPAVIGKTVTMSDETYTVVGVAPRGFTGPVLSPTDVWYPMSLRGAATTSRWTTAWNAQWLQIIVRLKDGVAPARAEHDATAAFRAGYTGTSSEDAGSTMTLGSLRSTPSGKESLEVTVSRWLVGVAAIVLLVACANVANLLLARSARRRRELAVRVALGSGRARLMRLVFTECVVLAAGGAVAGLLVASGLTTLMRAVLLPNVEWTASAIGWPILAISAAIAIVVAAAIGLAPALRAARPDLIESLKAGVRESGGQSSRLRATLTIVQAAVSVVLLVGAGLFVRSLVKVKSLDLGIQPDRVLVTRLHYPSHASVLSRGNGAEVTRRASVLESAMRRARALPGVEHASLTIGLPFQSAFGQKLRVPGWDSLPTLKSGSNPLIFAVGPDYFETVGGRILQGRGFAAADRRGSEPVAIVNQTMASILWRGRSPVGECLYWGLDNEPLTVCSRIVGVVANANNWRLREDPMFAYYIPFGQERGFGGATLVVRPRPGLETSVMTELRTMILDLDPAVSFVRTTRLQDEVDPQMRPWKLGATVFTLIGVLAMLVASVGLYSVMSYLVAQRTRELAVRIALGARTASIVSLVFRSGVGMVIAGVIVGTIVSIWAGRFLGPLLFDTSPRDPAILAGVGVLLIVVGILASVVPALRASQVNPADALRAE
ncbi:MAG TPA: ADOP family duplicated permease [Gemmatimonadaceae bacterium]|nr:ADOP family duplicated permease [Gemmatimonadaceae bacterium]